VQGHRAQALMERTVRFGRQDPHSSTWIRLAAAAGDVPSFTRARHTVPATTNPLGRKGCGEAGCSGALTR